MESSWIDGEENAKQMLGRVFMARPFLLPPPLHRVPLRVGNVVELVGPSPSAKTLILTQVPIVLLLLVLYPSSHSQSLFVYSQAQQLGW